MSITTQVELPPFHPFLNVDIPWLVRRAASAHGERTFMIWEPFEGPARRWTYAETLADVRRIAAGLQARGVKPRDAVILHLENSPESVLAWLACAEIGAVGVTTNARSAGEELAYFAEKSGAVGIITQPQFAELAREYVPGIGWMAVAEPGDDSLLSEGEPEPVTLGPAHPFSVQFTSGTTSRPKAVLWTHANGLWGAMVNARHLQLRPDDVALVTSPLFHTVAQAWQALGSMWVGAAIVVQPKFSASRFWPVVERNKCTWCMMGNFAATALASQPTPAPSEHSLRFNLPGVSMPATPRFFGVRGIGAHGMTELITHSVLNDPLSVLDEGSMGRPAPEYEIRVVRDDGAFAGPGDLGELQVKGVRGLSIFAEYLGDPEANAKAFTEDGFFHTGDLVTLRPDGALVFSDRAKDMLKVGGENVAASEIEAVIRQVPGVQEVAVVGGPDPMRTEVPVAFVIAAPGAADDLVDQINRSCAARLADFKRPRSVRLVESMPRAMETKVVKAELRRMLQAEAAQ
jgi:crotonobetaine/carnitine-CoA ligase